MKKIKISIIVPTIGRNSLNPLLKRLLEQKTNDLYEIIVISQKKVSKLNDKKIFYFYEKPNLGFPHYRNLGMKYAKGEILVYIDDDELPFDNNWLSLITSPIIKKETNTTTSGYRILLNKDLVTNSISLLGFPGGGAVGFKIMWPVKTNSTTEHICTGNFAITKKLLKFINGFNERLTFGNEDVILADRLIESKEKIIYVEKATVEHEARSGLLNFIRWNILRGKSNYQLKKVKKNVIYNLNNRIKSSFTILKKTFKTKYFLSVLFFMINQYFWQGVGYLIALFTK